MAKRQKTLRTPTTDEMVSIMSKLFECRDGMMHREEFEGVIKRMHNKKVCDLALFQMKFEAMGMKVVQHYSSQISKLDTFIYHPDI